MKTLANKTEPGQPSTPISFPTNQATVALKQTPPGAAASSRRSFFKSGALMSVAAGLMGGGLLTTPSRSHAAITGADPTLGDIAILKFLAAAELLECDLWGQYCELATGNRPFSAALRRIDAGLPEYVCQDFDDECSHAALINAYLVSIGQEAVNLDPFRTLPSSTARGAEAKGRLTSLTNLTVDTSYYNRYRGAGNPDFGDTFPQIVDIVNKPAIPTGNRNTPIAMATFAQVAAFHFGMTGGFSVQDAAAPRAPFWKAVMDLDDG